MSFCFVCEVIELQLFDINFGLMRKYIELVENVIWQELVKCLLPLSFQKEKKRSARSHVNYISLDQLLKTELFLNKWKVLHAIFINYRKFFKIKLWKMHGNSHFIKFHDLISFCFHFFFLDFINFWFCQSNLVWFCLHFNN